jgi:hypothetical protein
MLAVQSCLQKYFASPVGQIISTNSRHPTPPEGRIAIVTDAGCGCGGRGSVLRATGLQGGSMRPVSGHQASGREMLQRTAKSCGPDAPTLASSSRSCVGPTGLRQNISAGDGGKRARSPGRARHKLLKPLRAGMPGVPVYSLLLVCVLPLQSAHEAAGAAGTRHSPRPLLGRRIHANLGRIAPRDRGFVSAIAASRYARITGISRDRRARIIDPAAVLPIY